MACSFRFSSFFDSTEATAASGITGADAAFDENEKGSIQQGKLADLRLAFLVSEETAPANDLSNLRWHHLVPAFVPARNALQHVPGKNLQIFRIIVIELHEAAATHQITVERLQIRFHLHSVNGL